MATSYPIILVHGICPFHRVLPLLFHRDNGGNDSRHYFKKIRSLYRDQGFEAHHAHLSWAGGLDKRASDLRDEILKFTQGFVKHKKVHIIAHSMGGLDARWMAYKFHMADKIASLTTIGTPHHGTAYADRGIARFGKFLDLMKIVGLNLHGFKALTRPACKKMNQKLEEFERKSGILFRTVAGAQPIEHIFLPLRRSYRIIWKQEGANDGLVSVKSATWKEQYLLKVIGADHLNQIGWWDGGHAMGTSNRSVFEKRIMEFYLDLAFSLED